jgi:GH24 family phage-related lysozyme (muramidase)
MFNLEKLHEELIRDEGSSLVPYKDSKSKWTIGVGHLLGDTPRMTYITPNECEALLDYDINSALKLAKSCIPEFDKLDDVRQRALVNMAFNRGNNMRTSPTITPAINKAIEDESWWLVKDAIAMSPWRAQVPIRADRLSKMLETGNAV